MFDGEYGYVDTMHVDDIIDTSDYYWTDDFLEVVDEFRDGTEYEVWS